METITSMSNRWVKLAAQLKIKKYRDREGRFLLEGLRAVEDAWNQEKRDVICFVTRPSLDEPRVASMADHAAELHWLFLLTDESLMKKMSGTEHGQGILAIVKKESPNFPDLSYPLSGRYVLLDAVQDPGNVGTIIRTAAAAGVKGIFLTEGTTDPYAEKAVRSSMGSVLRLPIYKDLSLENVKEIREKAKIPLVGTALEEAQPYQKAGDLSNAIFVFGNEGNGIRPEILSLCTQKLYIPMAGSVESLNVSACAAVILFHFYK